MKMAPAQPARPPDTEPFHHVRKGVEWPFRSLDAFFREAFDNGHSVCDFPPSTPILPFAMQFLSLALLVLSTVGSADAHSYLTVPKSRYNLTISDQNNTVGCPLPKGEYVNVKPFEDVASYKAGEKIDVRYWRNNHFGGFIRWSIVPRGKEHETKENFDKNVFHYSCRESEPTCLPMGDNTMYAGDNTTEFTVSCGGTINLPDWLPAGDYTLQWMWFGVGSSYGNHNWEEKPFKSCSNIKLTTSGTKSKAPTCPTFTGGDRVTELEKKGNDQCFYFHSTEVPSNRAEPYKGTDPKAVTDYHFGIPADIQKCSAGSSGAGGESDSDGSGAPASPSPAGTTAAPSSATKCKRRSV